MSEQLIACCAAGASDRAHSLASNNPGLTASLTENDKKLLPDAAWKHKTEAVRLMLSLGFDPEAKGDTGGTALGRAAERGYTDIVDILLAEGADVHARDNRWRVPLQCALSACTQPSEPGSDFPGVVQRLLDAGTSADRIRYPVDHKEIDKILLRHLDKMSHTDLVAAIKLGRIDRVRSLIERRVPGQQPEPRHWFAAISSGSVDLVRIFLDAGVDPKQGPPRKPVHMAAEGGHREILRMLIDAGADVNALDGEGMTAWEVAAQISTSEHRDEVMQILIDAGTAISYPIAVQSGSLSMVRTYLSASPDLAKEPWWLMMACRCGQLDIVRELVAHGANPRKQLPNRNHALWFACNKHQPGRVDIARFLLEHGAEVNLPGENDESPLHQAAAWGNTDMAEFLISAGANSHARDTDGSTPFDYAVLYGFDVTARAIGRALVKEASLADR